MIWPPAKPEEARRKAGGSARHSQERKVPKGKDLEKGEREYLINTPPSLSLYIDARAYRACATFRPGCILEALPMTDLPYCFDCRFFVAQGRTHNDLAEEEWDECRTGECRRHCPPLGPMETDRHGDAFRHFSEWPKVMAGDWCGEFEPKRSAADAKTDTPVKVTGAEATSGGTSPRISTSQ